MTDSPEAQMQLSNVKSANFRFQRFLLPVLSLIIFLIASFAIYRIVQDISMDQLIAELNRLTSGQVALALLFTMCSYLVLSGYDWLALRYIGRKLPFPTVALATFCSCAISYTVGLNLLSGGSVRYRVYVSAGLKAIDVVHVTLYGMVAFAFGTCFTAAIALAVHPEFVAGFTNLSPVVLRGLGIFAVMVGTSFVVFAFFRRFPLAIGRWKIRLPSGPVVLAQLSISIIDIFFAGGCFYILIPDPAVPFFGFIIVYALGIVAGMLSHVPGGLGVFDSIILLTFAYSVPAESLAAALIVYRVVYYLIPLALATTILAFREVLGRSVYTGKSKST